MCPAIYRRFEMKTAWCAAQHLLRADEGRATSFRLTPGYDADMFGRLLSPRSLNTLAEVISGGSCGAANPIGIYRSAASIERFMRACNEDFQMGAGSRVPTLESYLIEINREPDAQERLTYIIEQAANPADFAKEPEKFQAVLRSA